MKTLFTFLKFFLGAVAFSSCGPQLTFNSNSERDLPPLRLGNGREFYAKTIFAIVGEATAVKTIVKQEISDKPVDWNGACNPYEKNFTERRCVFIATDSVLDPVTRPAPASHGYWVRTWSRLLGDPALAPAIVASVLGKARGTAPPQLLHPTRDDLIDYAVFFFGDTPPTPILHSLEAITLSYTAKFPADIAGAHAMAIYTLVSAPAIMESVTRIYPR